MPKYNVLIVGAGNQGALNDIPGSPNQNKAISFAHAVKEHPGFKLLGFADKNEDSAKKAMRLWDSAYWYLPNESHGRKEFYSCVDIAVISTPDETHYAILKQLANYPLKLVICEKPLCTDLTQAREIVELYKAKGITLMVNYTRRFLPYYQDLKRRYEAGEFGELAAAVSTFNRGWAHTGTHAIDFFEWFFSKDRLNIPFLASQRFLHQNIAEADYRIWRLEMFFKNYHWREERIGDQPVWPYYDRAMWYVMDAAFEFLEGRGPIVCSGEDALRTLEVCFRLMGQ